MNEVDIVLYLGLGFLFGSFVGASVIIVWDKIREEREEDLFDPTPEEMEIIINATSSDNISKWIQEEDGRTHRLTMEDTDPEKN